MLNDGEMFLNYIWDVLIYSVLAAAFAGIIFGFLGYFLGIIISFWFTDAMLVLIISVIMWEYHLKMENDKCL